VPTAQLNGIDVYFERSGEGRRLLFLNASGATLASAGLLVKPFADAADTVAADQRGLGRTEIPPGPYSMADYAADALALADHIGWDTFAMVGVSFGGMVAQEVAVTGPERVERLALLCTSPGGPRAASYPLETLDDLPAGERVATGMRVLDARFTSEWLADHPVDQLIVDTFLRRDAADHTEDEARGLAEQLAARSRHDVVDRLGRITCPTFVGNGRYDGIAPVSNGELIAAEVDDATFHVYEGGHLFVFQDAAAFPDVIAFLTDSGSA
jgi:pimeloyl-ACP methyl ester carboxylesterase